MAITMQKIDEYELRRYGSRSLQMGLPKVYALDNNLEANRNVAVFRANIFGIDSIVVTPIDKAGKLLNNINAK